MLLRNQCSLASRFQAAITLRSLRSNVQTAVTLWSLQNITAILRIHTWQKIKRRTFAAAVRYFPVPPGVAHSRDAAGMAHPYELPAVSLGIAVELVVQAIHHASANPSNGAKSIIRNGHRDIDVCLGDVRALELQHGLH